MEKKKIFRHEISGWKLPPGFVDTKIRGMIWRMILRMTLAHFFSNVPLPNKYLVQTLSGQESQWAPINENSEWKKD